MNKFHINIRELLLLATVALFLVSLDACSNDDDPQPRSGSDLVGVWSDSDNHYLDIESDTKIYSVFIEEYEGEKVGMIEPDGYFYEPGYNFVVYMGRQGEPCIYEVTELTTDKMTWVYADNLLDDKYDGMSRSEILGSVLKNADKGFKLDYSKTINFTRVPQSKFDAILSQYGIAI